MIQDLLCLIFSRSFHFLWFLRKHVCLHSNFICYNLHFFSCSSNVSDSQFDTVVGHIEDIIMGWFEFDSSFNAE